MDASIHNAGTAIFVGRQPIFDRRLEVYGYELLFRRGDVGRADVTDGEQATAQVILNTFMEIGLDPIVDGKQAFLNCTRGLLVGRQWMLLPRERVVLEVLEDVSADTEVLAVLYAAGAQGYTVALDDFICHEERQGLLSLAHIVKLDLLALPGEALEREVERVRRPNMRLLAEKIETEEDFQRCKALGFDYFQGYFFCRPTVIKGQRVPISRLSTLRLLFELQDPEITVDRLDELIRMDLSLSYKVLRFINSAFYGMRRQIDSVREAVVLLGLDRIRMWASLLAMAGLSSRPREVLNMALVRARMCEELARARGDTGLEKFFTVGLFSLLDVLAGQPLEELLPALPLSQEVCRALLAGEGRPGEVLRCVRHYERGEWDQVVLPGVEPERIKGCYLRSLRWTAALTRDFIGQEPQGR